MSAEGSRAGFWGQGLLILLPLGLLAGVGLFSLRQDRALAEVAARERCQDYAARVALDLSNRLAQAPPEAANFSAIGVNAEGKLVSIGGLTNRARLDWLPQPSPASPAQEAYDRALGATNGAAREALLAEVATNRAARSEAGLPLWLLADFQLFKLRPSALGADALCSNAVNAPSFVSGEILERANGYGASGKWLEEWRRDEAARDFYRATEETLRKAGLSTGFWVDWAGARWWTSAHDGELAVWPEARVREAVAAEESGLPPYAGIVVEMGGERFGADGGTELARSQSGPARALVFLKDAGMLYAEQRRRTYWFAAIIVVSAAAVGLGIVSAWRANQEQMRLSEMKTNFVSSVSHELRAPIASVRLLAEGLERGRVPEPAKQKEYYQLLSQESRRLSTLIENILDYSRIEQGRKTYEMEPTNLAALMAQTLALLRPTAAERQVALAWPEAERWRKQGLGATCDGLAMQQALINLIDNAVKHSPAGATVTIGAEETPDRVALWVEDRGPGIPAEEHEKIFERFYRRGSELRRETQGIGIGLTIVKHIAEAHGGRVTVRSEPGQGSRFTLEIPK